LNRHIVNSATTLQRQRKKLKREELIVNSIYLKNYSTIEITIIKSVKLVKTKAAQTQEKDGQAAAQARAARMRAKQSSRSRGHGRSSAADRTDTDTVGAAAARMLGRSGAPVRIAPIFPSGRRP